MLFLLGTQTHEIYGGQGDSPLVVIEISVRSAVHIHTFYIGAFSAAGPFYRQPFLRRPLLPPGPKSCQRLFGAALNGLLL